MSTSHSRSAVSSGTSEEKRVSHQPVEKSSRVMRACMHAIQKQSACNHACREEVEGDARLLELPRDGGLATREQRIEHLPRRDVFAQRGGRKVVRRRW